MKLIKALGVLVAVFVVVGVASHFHQKNSITLQEYGIEHPEALEKSSATDSEGDVNDVSGNLTLNPEMSKDEKDAPLVKPISPDRITYVTDTGVYAESFYYEPLSEELKEQITGISYPAEDNGDLAIHYDDLRYMHIEHINFHGVSTEGELICNKAIADDLLDIFYELYRNEYQLERVCLIDEYNGDDTASMEDNNTSCFNYRVVEGTSSLSKHALGLALDINPFYNPYVTFKKDGTRRVSPADAEIYADRSATFPYKIDENDLCYKLFIEHGFTWGGNWNSSKDYQHFQKTIEAH